MAAELEPLLPLVRRISAELTPANIRRLLAELHDPSPDVVDRVFGLSDDIRQREQRALVAELACGWKPIEEDVTAQEVRGALLATAYMEQVVPRAEIVWTGPEGVASTFRRTEQVVAEMLAGAQSDVMLVTYSAYDISELAAQLQSLLRRSVRISAILELIDPRSGELKLGPLRAMGQGFAETAETFYWPVDQRPSGVGRSCGVLHVKCLIVDRRSVLITSANLTKSALSLNMEMGLLVLDEVLGGCIASYFEELIRVGVLVHLGEKSQ